MTLQTTTPARAVTALAGALTDTDATRLLNLALHTPAGITAPAAAIALARSEAWVYARIDTGIEDATVTRLGPDLRAGAGLYQATRITVTPAALLAGALVALADRGWTPDDVVDDAGRVDLSGALHLAADVHPLELPADEQLRLALYDAEDALAGVLGADPARHDAGDLLTLWQTTPGIDSSTVTELVLITLGLI